MEKKLSRCMDIASRLLSGSCFSNQGLDDFYLGV